MNFDEIWNILDNSFEEDLHRTYDEQYRLFKENKYSVNTYEENNKCKGFITFWDFDKFIYIEHFAVDKNIRGKGIGRKLLNDIMCLDKIKILEVELPNTEIDRKRIKFYESFGFVINNHKYFQPPYKKSGNQVELIIMSNPLLKDDFFDTAIKQIHKNVYFVKE